MTFKQLAAAAWGDLTRGWPLTFRKLSAQIATVELVAVLPVLVAFVDVISPKALLFIFAGLTAVKLIAMNITQRSVKTYDPATHYLVKIVKRTSGDE